MEDKTTTSKLRIFGKVMYCVSVLIVIFYLLTNIFTHINLGYGDMEPVEYSDM